MPSHKCPNCGVEFDPDAKTDEVKKLISVPRDLAERFRERFPAHGAWTHAVNGFLERVVAATEVSPDELYDLAMKDLLNSDLKDR